MSAHAGTLIAEEALPKSSRALTVCHFTIAHAQLKSRSFHRRFAPLATAGINVRYVSPRITGHRDGVELIALRECKTRLSRMLALPTLLATLLRQDADFYHFQDPELLPLALALKLVFRRGVVYDAYEHFPSMAAAAQSVPCSLRPLAARTVALAERLAALCFNGVMTADPLTLRSFAPIGQSRKLVFYNFPNLDFFPAPPDCPKRFDVVYRGGLSERAGTYVLLDAMNLLATRRPSIRLLLIGYFDNRASEAALRERIRALGLGSNVVIRGRLDHEDMAPALSEAAIGVCPLQPVPKFLLNIPVKVFEYWACGLPVVASDLPPIRPFFRSGQAGILLKPGSAAELAESIAWLLDRPEEAARIGTRGRALVEQRLNNRGEIRKLLRFFEHIVQARDGRPRGEQTRHA